MTRPGGFSANFHPDNLDAFRSFCSSRGEKYTKVLEQLALAYIESNGELIPDVSLMSVPRAGSTDQSKDVATTSKVDLNALEERLTKLEQDDQETKETFGIIFERLLEVEKATNCGQFRK